MDAAGPIADALKHKLPTRLGIVVELNWTHLRFPQSTPSELRLLIWILERSSWGFVINLQLFLILCQEKKAKWIVWFLDLLHAHVESERVGIIKLHAHVESERIGIIKGYCLEKEQNVEWYLWNDSAKCKVTIFLAVKLDTAHSQKMTPNKVPSGSCTTIMFWGKMLTSSHTSWSGCASILYWATAPYMRQHRFASSSMGIEPGFFFSLHLS